MKFNLAIKTDRAAARDYFVKLMESDKNPVIQVIKVSPKRSLNQNNYLHLLLGYFGAELGYTIEEAKQIYKAMSKDIYIYTKNDMAFIRSSAELSKEEMSKTIDKFRSESEKQGLPLPLATDQGWLMEIENEIERARHYL